MPDERGQTAPAFSAIALCLLAMLLFTLLDATGRVLAAGTLRSSGARSQALPFKASAPGVHVLLLRDGTALRFVAE